MAAFFVADCDHDVVAFFVADCGHVQGALAAARESAGISPLAKPQRPSAASYAMRRARINSR